LPWFWLECAIEQGMLSGVFVYEETGMSEPFDHGERETNRQDGPSPAYTPGASVLVEIIAYAPTAYYHCTHCEVAWREMGADNRIHQEQLESSLPEDLAREYQTVSDWVHEMFRVHCDNILLKVIDAASVEGFYKSLKYRARRYPAVIVNRQARFLGSQMLSAASDEIARQVASAPAGVS
jgi:hypothetical protein